MNQTASYQDVLKKYTQEEIFFLLLGYFPDSMKRYKSPFRQDKDAGCRFEKTGSWLYFIDNAGYNSKLKFNCFDMGTILYGISIELFCYNLLLEKKRTFPPHKPVESQYFRADIRIETAEWQEDDYFSQFDLPISFIKSANVLKIKDYWVNSKYDPKLIKNKFGKFKTQIAYYFPESGHLKLYFPDEILYKWISNTDINDVFNWNIRNNIESDEVILTKSGKDALILQYHMNVPTIALLNEQCQIPDKVKEFLFTKEKIDIIYDNDSVGQENSIRIENELTNYKNERSKNSNIRRIFTRLKDAGESYPRIWE